MIHSKEWTALDCNNIHKNTHLSTILTLKYAPWKCVGVLQEKLTVFQSPLLGYYVITCTPCM